MEENIEVDDFIEEAYWWSNFYTKKEITREIQSFSKDAENIKKMRLILLAGNGILSLM